MTDAPEMLTKAVRGHRGRKRPRLQFPPMSSPTVAGYATTANGWRGVIQYRGKAEARSGNGDRDESDCASAAKAEGHRKANGYCITCHRWENGKKTFMRWHPQNSYILKQSESAFADLRGTNSPDK